MRKARRHIGTKARRVRDALSFPSCLRASEPSCLPRRSGVVFVAVLGVVIVLTALVLVFSQNMRTESLAAANRVSMIQADAVELGAEKWVLANVEENGSDAVTICQIPANALQLAGGYFWVLNPNPDDDQNYYYGICDESSKLNINSVTEPQLAALPNMTDDIAASIVAWRGITTGVTAASASSSSGSAATSTYYQTLPEPYTMKNSLFETVEELNLIEGITPQIMYGYDVNHDGVISQAEQTAGGMGASFNGVNNGDTGIANELTCWSVQSGGRTSVSNAARLQTLMQNVGFSSGRISTILTNLQSYSRTGQFSSLSDFYTASSMTQAELKLLAGQITASNSATFTGLINANTVSKAALEALFTSNGGAATSSSDADSLISARGSITDEANNGIGWVVDTLGPTKAVAVLDELTSSSYQYSADIVAVSPDGRAFKRVKIVVDNRTSPAKIVYRKDLTSLGWPLPQAIRDSLRAGKTIDVDGTNSDTMGNSVTGQ